jgi:hypothetical protein
MGVEYALYTMEEALSTMDYNKLPTSPPGHPDIMSILIDIMSILIDINIARAFLIKKESSTGFDVTAIPFALN